MSEAKINSDTIRFIYVLVFLKEVTGFFKKIKNDKKCKSKRGGDGLHRYQKAEFCVHKLSRTVRDCPGLSENLLISPNIRESFTIRDTKIHLLISPNILFSLTFLFKFEGHSVRIFASVNVEEDWDPETWSQLWRTLINW